MKQNQIVISVLLGTLSLTQALEQKNTNEKLPPYWDGEYSRTWKYSNPYFRVTNEKEWVQDTPKGYKALVQNNDEEEDDDLGTGPVPLIPYSAVQLKNRDRHGQNHHHHSSGNADIAAIQPFQSFAERSHHASGDVGVTAIQPFQSFAERSHHS